MRIRRSPQEVLSKVSFKTVAQVYRLFRDVRKPGTELLTFLGMREVTPGKVIVSRKGLKMPLRSTHEFQQTFWDCWVRGSYEVTAQDRVVVDVGANVGYFTAYALEKNPQCRVYAIEPSSQNYLQLRKFVEMNALQGKVETFQVGVASQSGELSLNVEVDSAYHTSFGPSAKGTVNEQIRVYSLSDLFRKIGVEGQIDLLKMDCEGAEMDCLFGASAETLSRVRRLELEYHEWAGFSFDELRKRLEAAGLVMVWRDHNEADKTGNARFERKLAH
jgi:FkbM family methyltransferase